MKMKLYRPETINVEELLTIRTQLRKDLVELETGNVPEQEVIQYLAELLPQAEPLERNPAMRFFGFDKPENMPSDSRVEYFYWPTYLAAAITIKACLLYPGILNRIEMPDNQDPAEIFRAVLLGCTGRGFRGDGYHDVKGLVEVTEFFVEHGVLEFFECMQDICPEFEKCTADALNFLLAGAIHGRVTGAWGDDYTDRAEDILEDAGMITSDPNPWEGQRLYLAYGSNLNIPQMNRRCPGAKLVGTTNLPDWHLEFRGSKTGNYLTLVRDSGTGVPVAIWAVTPRDEANLDRYEGCPTFYYKKDLWVNLCDKETGKEHRVKAFAYIMHEERKKGLPTEAYLQTCREGYEAFGFDQNCLGEALEWSGE